MTRYDLPAAEIEIPSLVGWLAENGQRVQRKILLQSGSGSNVATYEVVGYTFDRDGHLISVQAKLLSFDVNTENGMRVVGSRP